VDRGAEAVIGGRDGGTEGRKKRAGRQEVVGSARFGIIGWLTPLAGLEGAL
jgi:hypothetical protein